METVRNSGLCAKTSNEMGGAGGSEKKRTGLDEREREQDRELERRLGYIGGREGGRGG